MDRISAFMDGESAPVESQQAIKRLHDDKECEKLWDCFHMVGDVMRGDPMLRADFVERLRHRMEEEPTVLAPRVRFGSTVRFVYSAAAAVAVVAWAAWPRASSPASGTATASAAPDSSWSSPSR